MSLVLEGEEIIELIRIVLDDDTEGALIWLKAQFKGKARELIEGG